MSKVYFLQKDLPGLGSEPKALVKFLDNTELFSSIKDKDFVGIKIHFGEDKNKGYIRPEYIKGLVEKIKRMGAKPFLFDTNTLYRGKRTNSIDHFNLAFFTHNFASLGIPIIIPDGLKGKGYAEVEINGKHFRKAKVTSILRDLDFLLVISHLTGHMLTGFGAAIKNVGMGCASRAGKMDQHCRICPSLNHKICILCKKCIEICPENAISLINEKIFIDNKKCIGCAQCISECPKGAIKIVWAEDYEVIQEMLVEYAKAALSLVPRRFFVNFSTLVTKDCDCMNTDEERIIPDSGILASCDILSIDRATIDLINQENKKDVFSEIFPKINYTRQFEHAKLMGLGELDYKLIKIAP